MTRVQRQEDTGRIVVTLALDEALSRWLRAHLTSVVRETLLPHLQHGPVLAGSGLGRPPGSTAEPELLTPRAAAAFLQMSVSKWCDLRRAGKVPREVRLGTQTVRWSLRELRAWVDAGCPEQAVWEKQWPPTRGPGG